MDAGLFIYFPRDLGQNIYIKVFDGQDIYFKNCPPPPPLNKHLVPKKKKKKLKNYPKKLNAKYKK